MSIRRITVLLCVLVVFAGCGSDGGQASTPRADSDNGASGGGNDDSGNSDGGGNDAGGDDSSNAGDGNDGGSNAGDGSDGWSPYEFHPGEYYEYEIAENGDALGTLVWEVLSVSDDRTEVTVRFSGTVDGESFEKTVTGPPQTVYIDLLGTPGGTPLMLGMYGPYAGPYKGERLSVGWEWSYSNGDEMIRYAVERTDSIAGRDVLVAVASLDDEPQYETWIDPDLAFAARNVVYDEGDPIFEVALVEYRRN